MTDATILDHISFAPNFDEMCKRLGVTKEEPAEILRELLEEAISVAKPKVIFQSVTLEPDGENAVFLNGTKFETHIVRAVTDGLSSVNIYFATCGIELEEWSKTTQGVIMRRYLADGIKERALRAAVWEMDAYLEEKNPGTTVVGMNPGSITDWNTHDQGRLYHLITPTPLAIGIELTKSNMMKPVQSLSGLRFASDKGFSSCQICSRKNCPDRTAAFDPTLYQLNKDAGNIPTNPHA